MKFLPALTLLIFVFPQYLFSQSIDSLQTDEQVLAFVKKHSTPSFCGTPNSREEISFIVDGHLPETGECNPLKQALGIKHFEKADFDNNGITDLLFSGYRKCERSDYATRTVFVVLAYGNDSFRVKNLVMMKFRFDCFAAKVVRFNQQDAISFAGVTNSQGRQKPGSTQIIRDTLLYKFDDFVEKNESTEIPVIEDLQLGTSNCFGTCPVFNILIDNKRQVNFFPRSYSMSEKSGKMSMEESGEYKAQLDTATYNTIMAIVVQSGFERLDDKYTASWTDDQTALLIITYNNGKTKTIRDYGLNGSYTLALLYKRLSALRETLDWEKVK